MLLLKLLLWLPLSLLLLALPGRDPWWCSSLELVLLLHLHLLDLLWCQLTLHLHLLKLLGRQLTLYLHLLNLLGCQLLGLTLHLLLHLQLLQLLGCQLLRLLHVLWGHSWR